MNSPTQESPLELGDKYVRVLWQGKYLGNKLVLFLTHFPQMFSYLYVTPDFTLEGAITLEEITTEAGAAVIVEELLTRIETQYLAQLTMQRNSTGETLH